MSIESISKLRLWIFWLIAILVIPITFLLCLEGGLRLFGVGQSVSFTTDCAVEGEDYYCENDRFIEQFFPKQLARQPRSFAYPKIKAAKTFRIFVLGASAAQGDPDPSYGFSQILKVLLRERFPAINFEVINTAITAINSHVVLPIAKDVRQHQADMAIIYLGNNEVVGPFGAGTIFSPIAPNLTLIRAGLQLKATRTGQLINRLISQTKTEDPEQRWQGMEMFLDKQVRSDDPALETVYSHFQDNLFDIIQAFRGKNIPVVISTVGSNLKDFPPLGSQHNLSLTEDERLRWGVAYQLGMELFDAGEMEASLSTFLQAEQIDASYADLQFYLGRVYLESGDFAAARNCFVQARNLDTLRFRADSRINDVIRSVVTQSSDKGVFLVDAVRELSEQSPQKIQGEEFYYEHVHLTFHGNYLLAREIAEKVLLALPKEQMNIAGGRGFLNEQECAALLAWSHFDQLRVDKDLLQRLVRPPFKNQLHHQQRLGELEAKYVVLEKGQTATAITADDRLYRQALQLSANDPWLHFNYGVFLTEQKNVAAAIAQFQVFIKLLPQSLRGREKLATSLADSGRYQESLYHYDALIDQPQVKTDRTKTRMKKAYALARLQRYEESMDSYEKALAEDQSSAVNIYHAMAKLKIKTGSLSEAQQLLEKAISHNNGKHGMADIYFNYGYVLKQLKKKEKSISAYKKAIKIYKKELATTADNDKTTLLFVLGRSYFEIGDSEEGSSYLQQAINKSPAELNYHLTLITSLARNGHQKEALMFTEKALKLMNELGRPDAVARLKSIKQKISPHSPTDS